MVCKITTFYSWIKDIVVLSKKDELIKIKQFYQSIKDVIIINNSASVISNAWVLRGWTCFCFIKIWKPVWNRKNHFYSILKRHRTYQRWLWLKLLVQQVIIEIFMHLSIGSVNEMIIPIQLKTCGPFIRFKKWRILHLLLEICTHQNKKWLLLFEWVHCCGKNFHDRLKWLLKFNTFESSVYFFFIWNFLWVEWKSYISEGLIVQTCIFRGEIVFSQINKSVIPRDFLKYQFETWQGIAGLEKLHVFSRCINICFHAHRVRCYMVHANILHEFSACYSGVYECIQVTLDTEHICSSLFTYFYEMLHSFFANL